MSHFQDLPYAHLLGTDSDSEIARQTGMGLTTIRLARARRGIPPFRESLVRGLPWPDLEFLLGWFTDADVGRAFGVQRAIVHKVRRRVGYGPRFPGRPTTEDLTRYPGRHPRGWNPDGRKTLEEFFSDMPPQIALRALGDFLRSPEGESFLILPGRRAEPAGLTPA